MSDKLDDALVGKGQATNEVQTITIAAGDNPFTLGFRGAVTSSIANAAAIVQTAIQGLATVGSGNATVAGSVGRPLHRDVRRRPRQQQSTSSPLPARP